MDDVTQFCIEEAALDYIEHHDAMRRANQLPGEPAAVVPGDPEDPRVVAAKFLRGR